MQQDKVHSDLLNACRSGNAAECEALIKAGAVDPNFRDEEIAWTPLFLAARNCHLDTVRVLIKHGADVNAKSKADQTPLHAVCWNKFHGNIAATVLALLQAGAEVNAQNHKGQTPLHWAAHYGHAEAVRYLLMYGADPRIRNEDGETPLDKVMGGSNSGNNSNNNHNHGNNALNRQEIADLLQQKQVVGAQHNNTVLTQLFTTHVPTKQTMKTWHESMISNIQSVHEAVLYYTLLRKLVQTRVCQRVDAVTWLEKAFQQLSKQQNNFSHSTTAALSMLMEKAVDDGMITTAAVQRLSIYKRSREDDSTLTSEGPPDSFTQFVATATGIDGSMQSLQNCMGLLFQKMMVLNLDERELLKDTESRSTISLEVQQRLEIQMQALINMLRGILNVVARGADPTTAYAFERICTRVMDWGDLEHLKGCIREEDSAEDLPFEEAFDKGVALARDVAENVEDENTAQRLDSVFAKKEPFLLLGMIAAMAQPQYGRIDEAKYEHFVSSNKPVVTKTSSNSDAETKDESFSSHDDECHSLHHDTAENPQGPPQVSSSSSSSSCQPRRPSHMSPIAETSMPTAAVQPASEPHPLPTEPRPSGFIRSVAPDNSSSTRSQQQQQEQVVADHPARHNISATPSGAGPASTRNQQQVAHRPLRQQHPGGSQLRHSVGVTSPSTMSAPRQQQTLRHSLNAPSSTSRPPAPPPRSDPSVPVLKEVYPDARLGEEDELELVLHAAVKFGDVDLLNELLQEISEEELNATDSCGRTAMDLAALTGQTNLVHLLEDHGGKFVFKRRGPMLALARLRSLYVAQYLKLVEEAL